jgi:hypothetical protein
MVRVRDFGGLVKKPVAFATHKQKTRAMARGFALSEGIALRA